MATLTLKADSRTSRPRTAFKPALAEHQIPKAWRLKNAKELHHYSGFVITFYRGEDCEITRLPTGTGVSEIRQLTQEALDIWKHL